MSNEPEAITPEVLDPDTSSPADQPGSIPPASKKPRKKKPMEIAKEMTVKAMAAQGISLNAISRSLGMHPSTASKILKRAEQRGEDVPGLVSAEMDEKTKELIKTYVDKGIKARNVRPSDSLRAAETYINRRWPTRQQEETSTFQFTKVDISIYANEPPSPKPPEDDDEA